MRCLERFVYVKEPADANIALRLTREFTGTEPFVVLENCGHLIPRDNFLEERAIDVVTLHRLALFAPAEHVTCRFEHLVEEGDARRILLVSKGKSIRNALRLVDVV